MSWLGDAWNDVKSVGSAVANPISHAITAPFQGFQSSVSNLYHLRPAAAVRDQISSLGTTAAPVTNYTAAVGEGFLNFGKGAYHTIDSLGSGDLGGAGAAAAGTVVSGTNISTFEAGVDKTAGLNPADNSITGYSGLSYGNYSQKNLLRSAGTTAVLGAAAGGAALAGTGAGGAAADGAVAGIGTAIGNLVKQAEDAVVSLAEGGVTNLIGGVLGGGSGSGTNSAPPYASPGSPGGLSQQSQGLLIAGVAAAGLYILLRGRKK